MKEPAMLTCSPEYSVTAMLAYFSRSTDAISLTMAFEDSINSNSTAKSAAQRTATLNADRTNDGLAAKNIASISANQQPPQLSLENHNDITFHPSQATTTYRHRPPTYHCDKQKHAITLPKHHSTCPTTRKE